MPSTPLKALPYPAPTDAPNVPLDVQRLAEAVEGLYTAAEIPDAVNLNTMTTPGVFAQSQNGEATTANNYPVQGQAGLLEVFRNVGGSMVWQRYTLYGGVVPPGLNSYTRGFYGTWTAWVPTFADTGWTNFARAGIVTGGTLKWRVLNNIVWVFVNVTANTTSGTTHRLDAGALQPPYVPSVSAFSGGNFAGYPGSVFVGNGGDVSCVQNSGGGRASVAGVVSYPIGT